MKTKRAGDSSPASDSSEDGQRSHSSRAGSPGLGGQLVEGGKRASLSLGLLIGSLCTLALLSLSRGNAGISWIELGLSATTKTQQPQQVHAGHADCPLPPVCKAKACPSATKCPAAKARAAALGTKYRAEEWARRLTVPWGPLLTQDEAQRAMYYGSGTRLQQLAAKLLDGEPIKVFTLGASVTRGIGTTNRSLSYANRFFQYINTTFPHKKHTFVNRGIGGTSSSIFSVCAEHMVHEDADLVVLEFSANDQKDAPYSHPERKGYEQLIRKLLQMPGRPALIQLHFYPWWHAVGDGVEDGGLFYYPAAEAQLGVFAQYYDLASVSVRAAMWHLMRAQVNQFNPDAARAGDTMSPTNVTIPGAELGKLKSYWYRDRTHPGDEGHGMLAELLAHVLGHAVLEVLAPRPMLHLPARDADLEDLEGVVSAHSGDFSYKPEQKNGKNFVEQKWGWSASEPGSWVEVEFDSESGFEVLAGTSPAAIAAAAADAAAAAAPEQDGSSANVSDALDTRAEVSLSFLKSYRGMGVGDVECVSGCTCDAQVLDGTWEDHVSLQQIMQFRVGRHKRCRLRITVAERPGAVPQDGHKVVLMGIMVSQFSVRLTTYGSQMHVLQKTTKKGVKVV